jgi:hypothetical protein
VLFNPGALTRVTDGKQILVSMLHLWTHFGKDFAALLIEKPY